MTMTTSPSAEEPRSLVPSVVRVFGEIGRDMGLLPAAQAGEQMPRATAV